jgi:hypothetical protein
MLFFWLPGQKQHSSPKVNKLLIICTTGLNKLPGLLKGVKYELISDAQAVSKMCVTQRLIINMGSNRLLD